MSTQAAPVTKPEGQQGSNPGKDCAPASERAAITNLALKLTKTKQLFFHFEIGFKRTAPVSIGRAAEVQAPLGGEAVPQPLAFPASAPRPAAPALDAAAAPAAGGSSGSTQSGAAVYVLVKGGTSQTPPDGYPPPP